MTETFHAGPGLGRLSDVTIIHGDCLEAMAELAADSVDAIVTDPPYGLGFMGKAWDELPPGLDWAKQCYRVLKPGGHLLAFGGTRTWHRLAVAVEDAGFEIRDSIAWLRGSGFPKSLDVSKAIDKAAGVEREVVGTEPDRWTGKGSVMNRNGRDVVNGLATGEPVSVLGAPATPEAEQWSGWGTALKPAFEPVVVARKPFKGTVAANVLAHGTGALNIDATRIGTGDDRTNGGATGKRVSATEHGYGGGAWPNANEGTERPTGGRWPANVVLDAEMSAALDEQSGTTSGSGKVKQSGVRMMRDNPVYGAPNTTRNSPDDYGDSGGASRFFLNVEPDPDQLEDLDIEARFKYCAKAPKKERPVVIDADGKAHRHATVKPLALMRWLVRLVTPPGGTILDPFAGSGTTVEAALLEGFRIIGIEREGDYLPMIQQRIARSLDA